MSEETPRLRELKEGYQRAKNLRSPFDDQWNTVQRFVRPDAPAPMEDVRHFQRGGARGKEIYDGTAPWAAEEFASGLHSMLTDSTTRWFGLGVVGEETHNLSRESRLWLEELSDQIYHDFSLPKANVNPTLHENYLDLGTFGTTVQFEFWDPKMRMTRFRPYPLANCYIEENADGEVDMLWRAHAFTLRQLLTTWPHLAGLPELEHLKNGPGASFEVVHVVMPREERDFRGFTAKNKPFASFYFSPELSGDVFEEGGFDIFPYNVPRWTKMAGETYGRSPAMRVLADIQMANQINKELLVAAQIANFPPLVFENGSILLPPEGDQRIKVTPRSILFKESGAEHPQPVISGSQPQLTLEMLEAHRTRIIQAFYIDHLIRARKKERQTVTEILDERGEMMRQLSPQLGRLHSEMLSNMISGAVFYAMRAGRVSPAPAELEGAEMKVAYTNPAAKAQLGTKASQISSFLEDLAPVANIFPNIFQGIDEDELLREMANTRDITLKILKDKSRRAREKQQQEEQQQAMMAAEAAPNLARTAKDLAQARQIDPSLLQ